MSKETGRVWTKNLITLAAASFFVQLGMGFQNGVATNFYVQELGLGGDLILWLAGIREIPGLLLMFLAALLSRLPLARRGVVSVLLMALGYGLWALVHSYTALIACALIASVGFHLWTPLIASIGMGLVDKARCGAVLGRLNSIGALAALGGMLLISQTVDKLGLRVFFILSGIALVVAAALLWLLPTKLNHDGPQKKLVFRPRYWLYYTLTFFEGSRTQVFFAFASWVLVEFYGMDASKLPLLLVASGLVNWIGAPVMGAWIDRLGERRILLGSYLGLALAFVGYATLHNVWLLCGLYVIINYLVISREALNTYINRIALPGELVPTLSAGVSVNHITSVTMSFLAGTLLRVVGYETLSWGVAVMILLSCPFAWLVNPKHIPFVKAEEAVTG